MYTVAPFTVLMGRLFSSSSSEGAAVDADLILGFGQLGRAGRKDQVLQVQAFETSMGESCLA